MKLVLAAVLLCSSSAVADDPFPPLQGDRWAAGGQFTVITQAHPAFDAKYTGKNSLRPEAEQATSVTGTLFFAATPWPGGFIALVPEIGVGSGVSGVVGAGAFPNADIVRVPSLPPAPYIARAFVQHTLTLSAASSAEEPLEEESRFAAVRSEPRAFVQLTLGKLGINDLFDLSEASNDPRHKFLNWALVNQGAWDYCADVRGYTWAAVAALGTPFATLRAGACMMPTEPNGPELDTDLAHARSEVAELTVPLPGFSVSLLGYLNHARAARYDDPGFVRTPGALKKGLSLHVEGARGPLLWFARAGFNDGATETFAYSEIDRSLSLGATLAGASWGRADDLVGLAYESGGLSRAHADFLGGGGSGFLLGDGALRYGPEQVFELFYSLQVFRGVVVSLDGQLLLRPGFNADRGPVPLIATRLHFHL